MNKDYLDAYKQCYTDNLPLFDKNANRDDQAKQIGKYVADFDGKHYDKTKDKARLTKQMQGVYECINSGDWKTVEEIADFTGYPQPSISAQLRNLRKEKFGGLNVKGRYRDRTRIFEYKLMENK